MRVRDLLARQLVAVDADSPIHEIAERWIGKFERSRLDALSTLKKQLESGEKR